MFGGGNNLSDIRHSVSSLDYAIRFAADDVGVFTGHAAVFGEPNSFNEVVAPGAFKATLADHKARGIAPPMLWSHRTDEIVGVWTDLREDETGLAVAGRLVTETAKGAEALALMKAGALTGLSIGFRARQQERGPKGIRVLTEIELVEISLVALPAAPAARIKDVRSMEHGHTRAVAAFSEQCRKTARSLLTRKD
jgi:hypothetical protein